MAPVARICLIGAECTGKTQLASALAREFSAVISPEFAREYAIRVARPLDFSDLVPIARGQIANENMAVATARSVVIFDTDLMSTVVYSRYYWGTCPGWIELDASARLADLYLLMDIDLPWIADAARDAAADRQEVHALFESTLREFGARCVSISGSGPERKSRAAEAIRAAKLKP